MVDIRELLNYNEEVRHRYFEALAKLPWDELIKNREASFHSLRNIFIHILGAIDHWIVFLLKEEPRPRRGFDDYETIEDVRTYMLQVEGRLRRYTDSLAPERLTRKCTLKNDLGETVEVTVEDVLIHVFEEEVHHRGELIALLWQMEIEPPLMGWKYL
jgi:uncharacterized damage-inducible protein DinB